MKKRMQTAMILAAMICMSISGCSERTVTPKCTSATEPIVKTSVTSVTTVTTEVPVTEVTEKFTIPSTVVETKIDAVEVVAVTTLTAPQTETPKVEIEQPQIQITTEYYEPTETTIAIITDDTVIPHSQLCTDENMSKVTMVINNHFVSLGSPYNPTLNKDNCGWFLTQTLMSKYEECSVNKFTNDTLVSFINEANAFLEMSDATYTDWTINCYAERQPDGEYNIYFCHE